MSTRLTSSFLRTTEAAAIAAARTTGQGTGEHSDHLAVEAMRRVMGDVPMRGRIVIGEGERDEAPMLYIGEELGLQRDDDPRVEIAVDPLEGTNLCAKGAPGSIAVLAAAEEGGLLHAPDCYMRKLIVGPRCRGKVDLNASVAENLKNIAEALDRDVEDLQIIVLERPRHDQLIHEIREAGARIRMITDGDLSPAVSACVQGTAVHAVMGVGGAPEGVIAAAAVRCLGGQMFGQLVAFQEDSRERAEKMGITDFDQIHDETTLAPGNDIVFSATGVTDGEILRGVTFWGSACRTQSLVMGLEEPRLVRFVDTIHMGPDAEVDVRL